MDKDYMTVLVAELLGQMTPGEAYRAVSDAREVIALLGLDDHHQDAQLRAAIDHLYDLDND